MNEYDLYSILMKGGSSACSAEDLHILVSIITIAAQDAEKTLPLVCVLGLDREEYRKRLQELFPLCEELFCGELADPREIAAEEQAIRELLMRFRTPADPLSPLLAALIARRSMRQNHLWQDLGLRNRTELSSLMQRHFAPLARRNHQDMKWKKFFYRMTCSEEGFQLCVAPVCSECCDFDTCFGEESGPSLLARNRAAHDRHSSDDEPSL